jgi:multiple sugar transport system substrate-binding protein
MSRLISVCRLWLVPLVALACLTWGCTPKKTVEDDEKNASRAPAELKLLVVDDPAMSAAIAELRAEWKARASSTIVISETTAEELLAGDSLPGPLDAIIYPAAQLGPLAERGWIAPLPEGYATNRELAWSDTFDLLQVAATNWGQVPHAIPFGSPVVTLYYRADLLAHLHRRPPATWSEYHSLAEILSRRENLGDAAPPADAPWSAAAEPLAAGWASGVFLARAAAGAKHRDHYSALFHIDSMEPLVGGPAFVRALQELVADARLGPQNQLELDAAAVRQEFLDGHVGLALTWPGHAGLRPNRSGPNPPPTGFAELPGAADVYNLALESWEKRPPDESPHVPLLGLAGRLGSVTHTTAQPAAFAMLAWLSGREWGAKVSSASPATTIYRHSQIKAPQPWLDPLTDTLAAEQYATSVHDALSHSSYLFGLRIPGRARYLAALDAAVRQTVAGEKSAADALAEAATEWRRITGELGVDAQRKAYRLSLGLEP